MDKPSYSEGNDLVCSLPKDWLNLWPPSSSGGVGNSFHCLDFQNSLASFDTQDGYDSPPSPPLMTSGDWSDMPFGENSTLKNSFSWPCPSVGQDFHKTTLLSRLDDILDNIKTNDLLEEELSDLFHMTQRPEGTETRDNLPFDGISGLTLCTGNQCDNFNSNACFGNQASKLPLLFTDCDQGDHLSAGNGCDKHMNGSHQVVMENIPLNFQELLHQDVDSDDSYPVYDGYIYSNECAQVSTGAILPGIHEFPLQGSLESSMMVSGAENNYWGFTNPRCKNITSNNHQEKFKLNCKVPRNQLQASIQFSGLSSEETTDDWCSPVQDDFSLTDTAFFPAQGSLTEDCLLPRSKMSSYPLYGNTGSVSIPQVTEGLIGSENICWKGKGDCLPCKIHATISHDECSEFDNVDWWPQRKIDEKVCKASNRAGHTSCTGFGSSQKMHMQEKNRADDISAARKLMVTQSSAANSKHCLMNPEPEKSGLDQLDSVTDCHTLVENIWNSSLMLFASHSSESDRLAEPEVETLLSVIHSLSKYLTHRAGVSAKCIQAASQPDKSHFGDDSTVSKKVSKLAGCYYREIDATDYETQESKLSDICSASRGIHVAEGLLQYMSDIIAESDQFQGKCYKKAKLSDLEKERESKRAISELQEIVEKLRDDFEFELKERDAVILLYKNLWSEAHAALSATKSEMEHIKTEVEVLKQKQFNTDARVLDVTGEETCKIRDRTSLETCLEVNLNEKENVMDQAAMYQGKDHKEPDMNTSLISPTDIMSKAHDERAFWERAAVLISREEGLRETHEIKDKTSCTCPVEDDLNPKTKRNVTDQAAILPSFRKDCEESQTKTNLNSLINVTSQVHCEDSYWERAASLFPWEESLGISEISRNEYNFDHDMHEVSPEREDIIRRFKVLQEYKQSDMVGRDSGKQIGEATFDVSGSWNNSLHLEEMIVDDLNPESRKSNQVHYQARQGEGTFWERASLLLSREKTQRESVTSEIRGRASSECSPKIDLNPKSNVTDQTTIPSQQNVCESPGTKKRQGEGTFWERASLLLSREKTQRESVTSEISGRASSECSPKIDLNPKSNVTDQTTIPSQQNVCESPGTKKNMSCLMNVIPQEHDEMWKQAAIMFSSEESPGESDRSRNLIMCNQNTMEREKILCRFKVLQKCSDHSNITVRDYWKQFGKVNIHESDSCNCSHVKENVNNDLNTESYKSNQENSQAIQGGGLASQNVYPNADEVQARLAVLFHREASVGEKEDFQTVVMSNYFEKQASCMLASEDIHDIVNSAYGTEYFSNSHLGPKSHMTFGREEFLCVVPATESSSEENTLIRNPSILSRLESFSSAPVPDVSIGSQSIYFGQSISNPYGDLSDTSTEYSDTASESDNVFIMDGHSQILSAGSSSMPKLDLVKRDIIGMQNQNCSNPAIDSADAECLSQEELGCVSECQHHIGQDTFSSEVESSSTDSEFSWQHVEKEEGISFQ